MKKIFQIVSYILIMIIFPAVVFGETDGEGMDMKVYTTFLSHGLLVLVLVMFSVMIYFTSHYKGEDPVPVIESKVYEMEVPSNYSGLAGIMKYINIMYYAVIALILIYGVILITTIL